MLRTNFIATHAELKTIDLELMRQNINKLQVDQTSIVQTLISRINHFTSHGILVIYVVHHFINFGDNIIFATPVSKLATPSSFQPVLANGVDFINGFEATRVRVRAES